MPTPAWVTQENVKFDGTLTDVAVLKDISNVRSVVFWDELPVAEQQLLEALVNDYGGTAPMAAPSAGYQTVVFSVAKAGGTATGLANDATVYTASVNVDGTVYPVSVTGSAAQTFTTLLSAIDADLTGATSSIVSGNVRITSGTTGTGSIVTITDGTLFKSLTNFSRIDEPKEGVNDLVEALRQNKAPNNAFLSEVIPVKVVGDKPTIPPYAVKSLDFVYYAGNPPVLSYLTDDAAVGGGGGGSGNPAVGTTDFAF